MRFQALMVALDDASAKVLTALFDDLGVDYECCSAAEAAPKFHDNHIDILAVGFEESTATLIQTLRRSPMSKTAITLVMLADPAKVTQAFGAGSNFVLHLPLSDDSARATLRAAIALLQRERRRQFRVPVQLPVSLSSQELPDLEGILLDLSEGGMDVLAAKALQPGQAITVKFSLPSANEMKADAQVVWANANGQSGLQFLSLDEEQARGLSSWLGSNAPQVAPPDPDPLSDYKLSDLSIGGCYIETLAPFPKNTRIDLCMRVGDYEIHLDSSVRVVYPGHGMGVEFAATDKQRELVLSFFDRLSAQPGVSPDLLVWPKAINFKEQRAAAPPADSEDALLQLLCKEEALNQNEFLAELHRQRGSQTEVAPV